ncbi:MAG: type IV pilin protein [Sutterellaceae bacterium]|nr:prepilin-type N-terminal cleavage/methylation domain-containing protein [Burkholderiaceae bacterium]MCX7900708.1 prepilin-type N-terminal cleavage/methylation domain-containing protein [Burkholderiaceae bacterium]MDW8429725.1 type IV pilin protein [Sutterellaceae bacterium]
MTAICCNVRARGFTLTEVLVTLAIIAILAALAVPAYTAYVQRAHRADAKTQLMEAAALLQRYFSQNNTYPDDAWFQANAGPLTRSPASGAVRYHISLANPGGPATFTLTATRTGSMAHDECGDLTLTHTGVRGIANATGGRTAEDCWGR